MAVRATQDTVEVFGVGSADARVTQDTVEVFGAGNPEVLTTQVVVEVWGSLVAIVLPRPSMQLFSDGPISDFAKTLFPALISSTSVVFEPSFSDAQTIAPNFIVPTSQLFLPNVDYRINSAFLASTAVLFNPLVKGTVTLVPGFISATTNIFNPGLDYPVALPFITANTFVFTPGFDTNSATDLPLITSTVQLFTPIVNNRITLEIAESTAIVFTPGINGSQQIDSAYILSTAEVYEPTFAPFINLPLIDATSSVLEPLVFLVPEPPDPNETPGITTQELEDNNGKLVAIVDFTGQVYEGILHYQPLDGEYSIQIWEGYPAGDPLNPGEPLRFGMVEEFEPLTQEPYTCCLVVYLVPEDVDRLYPAPFPCFIASPACCSVCLPPQLLFTISGTNANCSCLVNEAYILEWNSAKQRYELDYPAICECGMLHVDFLCSDGAWVCYLALKNAMGSTCVDGVHLNFPFNCSTMTGEATISFSQTGVCACGPCANDTITVTISPLG